MEVNNLGDKQNILTLQENGVDTLNFTTGSTLFTNSGRFNIMGGNVGIGLTNPSSALEVNGRIEMATWTADGDTAVYKDDATGAIGVQASDLRLKKNLTPITDALSKIGGITTYLFNAVEDNDSDKKRLGVIAQDVKEVLPEATFSFTGTDGIEYYGVHYDKLGALAIAGLQEQQKEIETLSSKPVKTYDAEITSIQAALGEGALKFALFEYEIDSLKTETKNIAQNLTKTKEDIASVSASLAALSTTFDIWKDALFATNAAVLSASSEAKLFPKEATMSALLVEDKLSVNGRISTFDLTVLNQLMAGTIQIGSGIEGDEINAMGGIRFQTLSQGPVDFMGGRVVIGIDGSITAEKLNLVSKEVGKNSTGKATIPAGQVSIHVESSMVTAGSLIFATPRTVTTKQVALEDQIPGIGFILSIPEPAERDIDVQWLIVN